MATVNFTIKEKATEQLAVKGGISVLTTKKEIQQEIDSITSQMCVIDLEFNEDEKRFVIRQSKKQRMMTK